MAKTKRVTKTREFHGFTFVGRQHPLYTVWNTMRSRCYNPKHDAYPYYGGRGITVCDRWRNSFATFLADVGERPGPDYSLDRIDGNGDYEPDNVRWADKLSQLRNRSGVKLTLAKARLIRRMKPGRSERELARLFQVSKPVIHAIIHNRIWQD